MTGTEANPFKQALAAHNQLISEGARPVGQVALLDSLTGLEAAGQALVSAKNMGVIAYAGAMTGVITDALTLNGEGQVEPPLDAETVASLTAKDEMLRIFIDNDPGTGAPAAPSDTDKIPTGGRKG